MSMADKKEDKKMEVKEQKKSVEKKSEKKMAVARALYLPISPKHSINILNFIRYKDVDWAIKYLEDVMKKKKAIPFPRYNRDNPHRKGRMEKGKFPYKASKYIIEVLKSAKANAKYLGIGEEGLIIKEAIANKAVSDVSRRGRWTHIKIGLIKGEKKNA